MTLTDVDHWDRYWSRVRLPSLARRQDGEHTATILDALDHALGVGSGDHVLEIGGAPGTYLAHFAGRGAQLALLDYSAVGCVMARRNLEMLGVEAQVHHGDLFAPPGGLRADKVYSLGVVEHFEDLSGVLERHMALVAPGGRLVVGFPNFGGLYRPLLAWQRPADLADTHRPTMNVRRWPSHLKGAHGATLVEARYVSGVTPDILRTPGTRRIDRRVLAVVARALSWLLDRPPGSLLRRVDGRWTSGYALVTYVSDRGA